MPRLSRAMKVGLVAVAGAGALVAQTGCRNERSNKPPRQFFPDMDDQEKYKPQRESTLFADGRTMREPPANTVAYGPRALLAWGGTEAERGASASQVALVRADILKADERLFTGKNADGSYVATIPVPVTASLIRRGQERFNIYCTPCHGYSGDGLGMVGQQWSYALPSFHEPKFVKGSADPDGRGTDGFVFWTIRNGVPNLPAGTLPALKMPSYRSQVSERDAWAIVAYFRALQRSRAFPVDQVPETLKGELERTRGQTPPPKPAAPAPGAPAPAAPAAQPTKEGAR